MPTSLYRTLSLLVPLLALLVRIDFSFADRVVETPNQPLAATTEQRYSTGAGTADFIQYWSAFQLFQRNQNGYDARILHDEQVRAGADPAHTVSLWNPPWTVFVISPILGTSLREAALRWSILNAMFLFVITVALASLPFARPRPPLLAVGLIVLSFYPIGESLWWGQTSVLLATSLISGIWLLSRRRDWFGGVVLSLLSCKPHLFLATALVLTVWTVQHRRWRFPVGFVSGLTIWIVGTMLRWPQALRWWLDSLRHPPVGAGAVSLLEWKTATVAGALRIALFELSGTAPAWPMFVVPGAVCLGVLIWLVRARPSLDLLEHLPWVQCLALLGAPYGWRCDQAVLLFTHGCLLARNPSRRAAELTTVLAVQGLLLFLSLATSAPPHWFFWFPAVSLTLWLHSSKFKKNEQHADAQALDS